MVSSTFRKTFCIEFENFELSILELRRRSDMNSHFPFRSFEVETTFFIFSGEPTWLFFLLFSGKHMFCRFWAPSNRRLAGPTAPLHMLFYKTLIKSSSHLKICVGVFLLSKLKFFEAKTFFKLQEEQNQFYCAARKTSRTISDWPPLLEMFWQTSLNAYSAVSLNRLAGYVYFQQICWNLS